MFLERTSIVEDFDSVDQLKDAVQVKYSKHFLNYPIFLIDSEVVIANAPSKYRNWTLIDIYKISINDLQFKLTEIKNTNELSLFEKRNMFQVLSEFGTAGKRRSNLEGIYLRCGMVIQFPEIFTGINDSNNGVYDTFTKGKLLKINLNNIYKHLKKLPGNFPIVNAIREDLNFRFDMMQVDSFGWKNNKSHFDGLMGLFQRGDIELGASGVFMRTDRMDIIDFTSNSIKIKARIIFRQPPLPTVSNIFVLPFSSGVWLACAITICFASFVVLLQKILLRIDALDFFDPLTLVMCAICQQGWFY